MLTLGENPQKKVPVAVCKGVGCSGLEAGRTVQQLEQCQVEITARRLGSKAGRVEGSDPWGQSHGQSVVQPDLWVGAAVI